MNNAEVYAAITEKIIANLETSGSWQKFWDLPSPVSLNGHFYRGINYLILSNDQFKSRVYGTFGQIRANGGQVRKGEKSTLIVFWKKIDLKNASTGETDSKFILRYYHILIANRLTSMIQVNRKLPSLTRLPSTGNPLSLYRQNRLFQVLKEDLKYNTLIWTYRQATHRWLI